MSSPDVPNAPEAPVRRSAWRAWAWAAAILLALPLLVLAGIAWLATTASGAAWLVARIPGLTVTAPQGSLLGDFAADRVIVVLAGGDDRVVIDGLRWEGLALRRAQAAPAWLRVEARALRAARIDLKLT
ncbi:MAG TPA: hypothetical protein PL196_11305, partial [Burkholderiaceae bacterium]|nr:hypothetical protein [Burkholderiaceae bacterium]